MTKKKLLALILAVSFIFFSGASFLNFSAAKEYARMECKTMYYSSIANVRDELLTFTQREEKDVEELQESLRNSSVLFNSFLDENRTYAYVVADKEGNIVYESESGVWFWKDRDTQYLSLEKYMTSEIKKEILDFRKKSEGDHLLASNLCVNLTDGVYTPVSVEITDNHFSSDNDESLTVKFTDKEVTHTFYEYLTFEYYNLEDDPEYDETKEKLEQELKNYDYSCNARLSLIDTQGGDIEVIETVGDYHFIGFVKYNLTRAALTSGFFGNRMLETAIVFVILTVVSLCIATVVFNKSVSAEKKEKEELLTEEEKRASPED